MMNPLASLPSFVIKSILVDGPYSSQFQFTLTSSRICVCVCNPQEPRQTLTNSHLGQMVSVFPSSAPTPRLAAALVLRISTSEAIGAGFRLDIVLRLRLVSSGINEEKSESINWLFIPAPSSLLVIGVDQLKGSDEHKGKGCQAFSQLGVRDREPARTNTLHTI